MSAPVPDRLVVYPDSVVTHAGTTYRLLRDSASGQKWLTVEGDGAGFAGAQAGSTLLCPLSATNAAALRARLPWLNPVALGLRTSAGFGDRLGLATPGHVRAVKGTGIAPIFAQQSVRENARTGRTPQQVLDDAMWGVLQEGWHDPWGADADHLKTPEDIAPFVQAGYSFFTVDPSAHVDNAAQTDDERTLRRKVSELPWEALGSSQDDLAARFLGRIYGLGLLRLAFEEVALLRAAAKYGRAIAHVVSMYQHLRLLIGERPIDFEVSVDETDTPTAVHEHFFIAAELRRLGVHWISLAPRFVGHFEKGVDYIGDLAALEANLAGHAAVLHHFGGYKLSLHSGSDKFSVYPLAARHAAGLVHLKTAGTSYLEALRVWAEVDPTQFRAVLDFARERYPIDRATYHVSAEVERVPAGASLADEALPTLLDAFDARQVLHVTYGSVLDRWGKDLPSLLRQHEERYTAVLASHFARHLEAFRRS